LISLLGSSLGVEIDRAQATAPGYHPTRTARLTLDGVGIGYAGELHPDVADRFELGGRVAVIEFDLDPLLAERPNVQMVPVSTFPHVDFDLSFEVAMDAAAGNLAAATAAVSALVERAVIFDDYRDPDRDLRAVAVRYRLRAGDRTLEADEIAGVREAMIGQAASLGATLRGAEG
jgi:phenylalanyl-tRNA synthetase beta chain